MILAAVALLTPAAAIGNSVEDQFGLGSRAKAMGGAGTVAATDGAAVYYNPAGLARCPNNQITVELSHVVNGLATESGDADAPASSSVDRTALAIGACLHLPHDLSLGLVFDTGLQRPLRLDQRSLNDTPLFAHYGAQLDAVSLLAGLSYRASDKFVVGIGGSVLANSALGVGVVVPIISVDDELAGEISWDLNATAALHAGVAYRARADLLIGAALRTPLYHKLDAEVVATVQVAGVLVDVDLLVESVAWYSPLQAAIGGAYQPAPSTTITADLTWYHWSAYPGPYLHLSPLDPNDTVAAGLVYPPEEEVAFSDIFVPRLGAEYWATEVLALRAGFAYRPSTAPLPTAEQRANLLDAPVATVTLGAGYEWGGDSGADAPKSNAPKSKAQAASYGRVDFHARLHHMQGGEVDKVADDGTPYRYHFGGQLYDGGITLTLGW